MGLSTVVSSWDCASGKGQEGTRCVHFIRSLLFPRHFHLALLRTLLSLHIVPLSISLRGSVVLSCRVLTDRYHLPQLLEIPCWASSKPLTTTSDTLYITFFCNRRSLLPCFFQHDFQSKLQYRPWNNLRSAHAPSAGSSLPPAPSLSSSSLYTPLMFNKSFSKESYRVTNT